MNGDELGVGKHNYRAGWKDVQILLVWFGLPLVIILGAIYGLASR